MSGFVSLWFEACVFVMVEDSTILTFTTPGWAFGPSFIIRVSAKSEKITFVAFGFELSFVDSINICRCNILC